MNICDFIKDSSLETSKELVFFGGSFNPWHEGHSSCINLMPKNLPIVVIPDHNPFKEIVKSNDKLTSLTNLKETLSTFENKTYLFSSFFEKNEKNPTSTWVQQIKEQYPKLKISLLMGYDSFISLDKWIDTDKLLNNLENVYVASRMDDTEAKSLQIRALKQIADINIVFIGNHDFEHISSTNLRAKT
jgi:nicotinate-nucleotide adenylyltransferase